MAFCTNCGTKIDGDVKFCPGCGAAVEVPSGQQAQEQQAPPAGVKNDLSAKLTELNNAADTTADFEKADIDQNKVMGVLAYLSWLVLIPIFAAPKSKFARFHANQGLVLAITEIIYSIVYGILSAVIYAISWRLGFIVSIIGLVGLVFLVLSILGIVNAANGKAKELPMIGKFRILK